MATLEAIAELLKTSKEEEKTERAMERKEAMDEIKKVLKDEIGSIRMEVNEVKTKVDIMENKREQSVHENKLKFDDLNSKFGHLAKEMKEMKDKAKSSPTWPSLQPAGSSVLTSQPATKTSLSVHPSGNTSSSFQPGEVNFQSGGSIGPIDQPTSKIYSIVRKARRIVGISPVTEDDIQTTMNDKKITNRIEALEATVKDDFQLEMAIPEDDYSQLAIVRVLRGDGYTDPDSSKIYV